MGFILLLINNNNTRKRMHRSMSKTVVMALGPVWTNIWPINQGNNILPAPEPTRNQPVIVPVICIRSLASMMKVGKMDAMEIPRPRVPIHSMRLESFHNMIRIVLTAHPAISRNNIVFERSRVDTQTPSNLPNVNEPQNAAVKYADVISEPSPSVNA